MSFIYLANFSPLLRILAILGVKQPLFFHVVEPELV